MAGDGEPLTQVAGWRLNSGGVFMRASDDEGGKLARLADVRDWLMHRNEWPMERAAEEIVKKLREAHKAGVPLFMGTKKAYALPLRPDDHMLSPQALQERGGLFGLDERLQGFSGVCNAIINGWLGEYAGYGGPFARVDAVCVRAADAAQLWGWGSFGGVEAAAPAVPASLPADAVKDYATLCQFMQQYKDKEGYERPWWHAEWVVWVRAELDARGRGKRAAVARELGMSSQALAQVFERQRKAQAQAQAKQATPWDVLNRGGKAA